MLAGLHMTCEKSSEPPVEVCSSTDIAPRIDLLAKVTSIVLFKYIAQVSPIRQFLNARCNDSLQRRLHDRHAMFQDLRIVALFIKVPRCRDDPRSAIQMLVAK